MDAKSLNRALDNALLDFGHQGLLQKVLAPITAQIGKLWMAGEFSAAHEHFATGAITAFLNRITRPYAPIESAPCVVIATPAGQLHGLGALMANAAAANLGWRIAYLGTGLPAAEIALAVRQKSAKVLALSLVYPVDDAKLPHELRSIRQFIPSDTKIVVGGRATAAYARVLEEISAKVVSDLTEFCHALDQWAANAEA
jgi:methylmalonyl-CoA mutase cobalamin-binding subunit